MERYEYKKSLPIKAEYDVVVCGGGPGGIGAALASAGSGLRTLLIEKAGFLGGMATSGYVNPMSEFAYNGDFVIGGIPFAFANRLIACGGAEFEKPRCNLSFDPERYKLIAQQMVLESGAALMTNTSLVDCLKEKSRITAIVVCNRDGLSVIKGKYFIDATGDAVLAAMAEVPMLANTRPMQPGTLCFEMSGVDTSSPRMHIIRQANHRFNHQAMFIREKLLELREQGQPIPQFGGPWLSTTMQGGTITLNLTRAAMDSSSQDSFSNAEQKMLEDVFTLADIIKKYIPEFKDAFVSSVAPVAGTRQGRRIQGLHVLTGTEYLEGVHFDDSIARSCHPVDIHLPDTDGQRLQFPKDAGYIPYRSLITPSIKNLIMAGRSISADEDAFAAVRVQAPCMEMGQAAGLAASLCLKHNGCDTDGFDADELVELVRKAGSYV